MTKLPLVLVVDDEPSIRQFLVAALKDKGFGVEEVGSGDGALMLAASLNPAVLLVDLGLPDWDGKDLVKELRKSLTTPILVISARDQEAEKVAALNAGADDYLTKPFGVDELVARIGVALRHADRGSPLAETPRTWGELEWDPARQLVTQAGNPVHLTPLEYKLFAYLAQHPGRVLTHATLLRDVWGLSNIELAHYVRVAMAALRKKLGDDAGASRYIRTEIGTGYRFLG